MGLSGKNNYFWSESPDDEICKKKKKHLHNTGTERLPQQATCSGHMMEKILPISV